ncbi:von Hippel-Lindau disease tumor suppressor-like isoform X2 [Glandiceps talaboti]
MTGDNEESKSHLLKSKPSQDRALLRFINRSPRTIDVIWVNFRGGRVIYAEGLQSRQYYDVNSYECHPWIFRDHTSRDKLYAGMNEVHFPVPWAGEFPPRRHVVFIDLPVYSLSERCIQVIRKFIKNADIDDLEIPKELKFRLRNVDDTPIWNSEDHPECILHPEEQNQNQQH